MTKYKITVSVMVTGDIQVEAKTPEEAAEKAESKAKWERGKNLEMKCIDVSALTVYKDNKIVWEEE